MATIKKELVQVPKTYGFKNVYLIENKNVLLDSIKVYECSDSSSIRSIIDKVSFRIEMIDENNIRVLPDTCPEHADFVIMYNCMVNCTIFEITKEDCSLVDNEIGKYSFVFDENGTRLS